MGICANCLIFVSAVIIAGLRILPGAAPVEHISQPEIIPTISQFDQLTNQELRSTAYTINEQVNEFEKLYIQSWISLSGSPEERGVAKLALDEKLNREFRDKFASDILKIDAELARRLKIDDSSHLTFLAERLDSSTITYSTRHLVDLANRLP